MTVGLCRAGSAPSQCLVPVVRTGVWTEGSYIGGEFTGSASRSFSFQSVDMETRLPSHPLILEKITPNKLSGKNSRQLSLGVFLPLGPGLTPGLRGPS